MRAACASSRAIAKRATSSRGALGFRRGPCSAPGSLARPSVARRSDWEAVGALVAWRVCPWLRLGESGAGRAMMGPQRVWKTGRRRRIKEARDANKPFSQDQIVDWCAREPRALTSAFSNAASGGWRPMEGRGWSVFLLATEQAAGQVSPLNSLPLYHNG